MLPSQAVRFNLKTREIADVPLESLTIDPHRPEEIYWIHLDSIQTDLLQSLAGKLNLSELLIQELSATESLPDVSETEDSLTLTTYYWNPSFGEEKGMEPRRLTLHLTSRYCLTLATEEIPALEHFAATFRREFRFAKTPGFILFLVLDNLVDSFGRMLRSLDDHSERIDEQIHRDFSEELNSRILELKRNVITLRGFVVSLRDTLMRISGRMIPVISEKCRQSLIDIYGHSQILVNQLESLRELVTSSLDAYNTVLVHRMNDAMKVLTIFASIILPMSLIAGIYGMNFQVMPELGWKYGYLFALGLMALCAVGLLVLFKKKKWF